MIACVPGAATCLDATVVQRGERYGQLATEETCKHGAVCGMSRPHRATALR